MLEREDLTSSEHLRTSQNISEHLRTSSEHHQNIIRTSQNIIRTSQNISEHLRTSQNISEHLRTSQNISEHHQNISVLAKLCRCYNSKVHSLQQTLKLIANCIVIPLFISTVKPTRCTISQMYFILEQHSTFSSLLFQLMHFTLL